MLYPYYRFRHLRASVALWMVSLVGLAVVIATLLVPTRLQAQPTPPPYDPATVPTPAGRPLAALAADSYQENCAPCHGAIGNSDGPTVPSLPAPPPRFNDPTAVWERSPAEYFHTTKYGRIQNLMPPWGNRLEDEQIWQVVYYAWSLHTDQVTVERGGEIYAANCAACHGPGGAGDGPEASGQLPNFADSATMIVKSQADLDAGWQRAHPEIGATWLPAEQREVLDYLRTFTYSPSWESTYQPGTGRVRGMVVQGSAGGSLVSQVPVTLTAFVNFEPAQSFTTTTDAEGRFSFDNLATDPRVAYLATSTYAEIPYSSNIYQLSPVTPTVTITVPVYESTDDDSGLHINRVNWLIDFVPGAVRVGLIVAFGNNLDRTFTGQTVAGLGRPATIALTAPPGATEIEFNDGILGGRYQQLGEAIYDVAPVLPGPEARQVIYSYLLPFEGDATTITQTFLYPVEALNLLITELPGLEVDAGDIPFVGNETIQETTFRRWSTNELTEPRVQLRLSGLIPAGSPDPRGGEGAAPTTGAATTTVPLLEPTATYLLAGLVVLVLAGALYLPLRRGQQSQSDELQQQRTELIEQIAALDDRHTIGQLSDQEWATERARLKGALVAVAQTLAQTRK